MHRNFLAVLGLCIVIVLAIVVVRNADAMTYYGIDDGYGYGDITASGDPFDPWGSTAASPDLPFGTVINVCGPLACEDVVINDRCACELDVTKGVALRIGLI